MGAVRLIRGLRPVVIQSVEVLAVMLRQLLRLDFPWQRQVAVIEGQHEYPVGIVRRSEHIRGGARILGNVADEIVVVGQEQRVVGAIIDLQGAAQECACLVNKRPSRRDKPGSGGTSNKNASVLAWSSKGGCDRNLQGAGKDEAEKNGR